MATASEAYQNAVVAIAKLREAVGDTPEMDYVTYAVEEGTNGYVRRFMDRPIVHDLHTDERREQLLSLPARGRPQAAREALAEFVASVDEAN